MGLVSDTHGTLDPQVLSIFAKENVAAILHAGDIGRPDILWELGTIAPVTAVLGNNDLRVPGFDLPMIARVRVGMVRFLVIHDFGDLGAMPRDVDVVVCGHSHRTRTEWRGKVLVANPGSASQRRTMPTRSIGIIDIADGAPRVSLRILELS